MTTPRSLPLRPSLDSLRKQAKKLAREVAAGNESAVARMRARLPEAQGQLSLRDAQRVIAREYGFAGWHELSEAVLERTGHGLDWAVTQAKRAIHDNATERLKQLLTEYPALVAWRHESGQALLHATTAYANDVSHPAREEQFFRPACAEILIDAGAVVEPSWCEDILRRGGAGMLGLLKSKGALPRTLPVFAALGDLDGVRSCFDEASGALRVGSKSPGADDLTTVNQAFMNACHLKHGAIASLLLDRCIALDAHLAGQVHDWGSRADFVEYLCEHYPPVFPTGYAPWQAFVIRQLADAIDGDDAAAFARWTRNQPWLLGDSSMSLQTWILEWSAVKGRAVLIRQFLELGPAILTCGGAPPRSEAVESAFSYGHADLVYFLKRIWPIPDDLPHAAGMGDLARVRRWFDDGGREEQEVLDRALAWACLNHHFEVAEFLLARGADINTRWSTHEPASILHECAIQGNYEGARFLVDHGIDLTICDYRWNGTAAGWAHHAARDERMYRLLQDAEERREKL